MKNETKVRIKSILWLFILSIILLLWWMVAIVEKIVNKKVKGYIPSIKSDYKKLFQEIKQTFYSIKTGKKEWI